MVKLARKMRYECEHRESIVSVRAASLNRRVTQNIDRRTDMTTWETPSFDDVRFGFEVTMYINNR